MQKVVNQHVLEQRISRHREVVLKQVALDAIFKAKRLDSPFALLHCGGEIPGGESLILWYGRCRTGRCCLPSPWEAGWRRTYGARCTSGQPRTHSSRRRARCSTRACGAGREAAGAVRGVTGATGDAGTAGSRQRQQVAG